MGEISYSEYLCANNPERANNVLELFGYPPVNDYNEQVDMVEQMIDENGQIAVDALISQHPDYELIIDNYKQTDEYHNATGTGEKETQPVQPTIITTNDNSAAEIVKNEYFSRSNFNNTFRDVVLIVMAFWLIKEIVKK